MNSIKLFLKAAWVWLKHYWKVPVIILAVLVLFIFNREAASNLIGLLGKQQDSYKSEIEKLKESQLRELKARDEALKRYQATLLQVESQYEERKQELDATKRKEVEKLIKESQGSPVELAQKLSEVTGFRIIPPGND